MSEHGERCKKCSDQVWMCIHHFLPILWDRIQSYGYISKKKCSPFVVLDQDETGLVNVKFISATGT